MAHPFIVRQPDGTGFDTVGGLVPGLLGRPQKVGDEVQVSGRTLRLQSVDELRVERVTVREESAESKSKGDRRRIFLRLDSSDLGEHGPPLDRIIGFLDKDPSPEVELVAVGSAATSRRANLLKLLTKSGLGVAVCGDALRVWCLRGAPGLQGLPQANRSIRYARSRGRKLR